MASAGGFWLCTCIGLVSPYPPVPYNRALSTARASTSPPSPSSTSPPLISPVRFNDSSPTSFSPLINGCWTLAGGHGFISQPDILQTMDLYSRSGLSTFDTADIYGPSESILGAFRASWANSPTDDAGYPLPDLHFFTKFVPNIFSSKPTPAFVEQSIRRSMKALRVQKLDLVQLHWWDYTIPGMIDVALTLADLRQKGLITSVGTTNMNTDALAQIVDAGVPVVCNQVQFSLLDRRPLQQMLAYCKEKDIKLLTYGSMAGGLLSDRYLKARVDLNTSSLKMYWRIVKEAGGDTVWKKLLGVLSNVASRKSVSIANVALRWVMQQGLVHPIVGLRNSRNLKDNLRVFQISLEDSDMAEIEEVLEESRGPRGDVYDMERGI